jgi:hypothetical protein
LRAVDERGRFRLLDWDVASFANELIDGRHDFLRVTGFVLKSSWDKPARRRGFQNPCSLFSGAAPDKFPICGDCRRFGRFSLAVGGGILFIRISVTRPFFKKKQNTSPFYFKKNTFGKRNFI